MSKAAVHHEPGAIFARNIDWNLFKVFAQIVRSGSITAAARAMNKTQPSVSAALQRLEDHVGATLCVRDSRGIKLTIYGEHLFSACQEMYSSVQEMPRAASAARGDIKGVVSLRVISNLYHQPALTRVIDEFHETFPNIEIKLDVASWRDVLSSLRSGDVELAIGFDDGLDASFMHLQISAQPQQLYCSAKSSFYGETNINYAALRNEPFVLTMDEPGAYGRFKERYELGRDVGGSADSLNERMWLIQLGMGIGFLPAPIVQSSSFSEVLWPLLREEDAPVCDIFLMANRRGARSAPAQLFLDCALQHFKCVGG